MLSIKQVGLALLTAIISTQIGAHANPIDQSSSDIEAGAGNGTVATDLTSDASNSSSLGLPFPLKLRDTITIEVRWTGIDYLKANNVVHMWLSFAREQWGKPWLMAGPTRGEYLDPKVSGSKVSWGIENAIPEHKYVVLGWGAVLAAKRLLSGFQPSQTWVPAAKFKLTWKNLVDGNPFAEIKGDIDQGPLGRYEDIPDINNITSVASDAHQTSKRGLVPRPDGNSSTESLGATESKIVLFVSDPVITKEVPTLDLLAVITETISIYIYQHKPITLARNIWLDGPELETVKHRGLILTFEVVNTMQGTHEVTIADLEQALRMLLIAPKLMTSSQTFEAAASIQSDRGGLGPPFVRFTVAQNSVREDGVGDANNVTTSSERVKLGQGQGNSDIVPS